MNDSTNANQILLVPQQLAVVSLPPNVSPEKFADIVKTAFPECSVGFVFNAPASGVQLERKPETPVLSGREKEVFGFLAEGHKTHTIAQDLHLSESTVRNHIAHISRKLGLAGKKSLVAFARK